MRYVIVLLLGDVVIEDVASIRRMLPVSIPVAKRILKGVEPAMDVWLLMNDHGEIEVAVRRLLNWALERGARVDVCEMGQSEEVWDQRSDSGERISAQQLLVMLDDWRDTEFREEDRW
ncbi:MAG TPA: hypothetical protein RMH80_17955 [Polyangiaceae bacterium LLY-WYZ-15_(1-7)]|nr:hypothetical protein [Polyangiaceae bacterium LLY-WYZ-15_(1-7)]